MPALIPTKSGIQSPNDLPIKYLLVLLVNLLLMTGGCYRFFAEWDRNSNRLNFGGAPGVLWQGLLFHTHLPVRR